MLVSRTGLSPVMVGRGAELDRLASLLATSRAPTVALVAGEAGIGKTRLVQELVDSLPKGTLVLPGQADPGTVGRPMDLFLDAVRRVEGDEQSRLHDAVADDSRSKDERVRAGVDLVRALAAGRSAVVVFEDLHWADAESLAVFERLAEPDGEPLLLVGTYRPDGLSRRHPAAEMLPRLERRHSVTHLHLGRLSPADVSTFLRAVHGRDPSYRAVDALHTRTGGNPFFLEELIAASGGATDDLDSLPLPWTVAELVRNQLDDLSPEVRDVVTAASVLGRRVSFDLLAGVTDLSESELIDRLKVAVDSGLLVETEADVFGFHHEIAREAIESSLLGRERRRLHQAALNALRMADSHDSVAIVHHARGAGHYEAMVDQARLGAHDSLRLGSTHQALALAETGLSEAEEDADLLSVATEAAWLVGLLDEALEHSDRWLALARSSGDVSQEACALMLRTRIAFEVGELDEMDELTNALIEALDHLPSDAERATAMAAIAQSFMLRDLIEPTVEWADKAIRLATAEGLDAVRIDAAVQKGSVLVLQSSTAAEGRELLEAAADEADHAGEHVLVAKAMVNLMWRARQSNRLDEARALAARMARHARAAGFDSLASYANTEALVGLAIAEGDFDGAAAILDSGARDDPSHSLPRNRRWLAVLRAGLALEAGDLDEAARQTEAAKPPTTRSRPGVLGLDLHLAARRGDLATVRARLPQLVDATQAEDSVGAGQVHDLMAAALPAGLPPAEMEPLYALTGLYAGHRFRDDHPWRRLLRAQMDEAAGATEQAALGYAAAAAQGDMTYGILARHRGTAHVGAARALIALDRLDEARTHAEAAAAALDRWRGWRVEELRAVERRLGIGPGPDGPEELTPREREVAALLAEGLTNAQVADRLYISPRTAAVHVSNILAKLDMASRAEVAAFAVREGLAPG